MSEHIKHWEPVDLATKSEREMLVLTVQRLNDIASHLELMNGSIASTKCRIGVLESWRDKATGALAVLMLVVPALVSWAVVSVLGSH